jgi:hypothetical protein
VRAVRVQRARQINPALASTQDTAIPHVALRSRSSRRRDRLPHLIDPGSLNFGGMTPMIVAASSLPRKVRPLADESPPYRLCQTPYPNIKTPGARG